MSDDLNVPPGWYADENDRHRERYWTGTTWSDGDRWRRGNTPRFPSTTGATAATNPAQTTVPTGSQAYPPWSNFIIVLATASATIAIIVGAVLISHTGQKCNPVCSTTHPDGGAGTAIIFSGVIEAAFIASFATLHRQMETLRLQLVRITDKLDASAS